MSRFLEKLRQQAADSLCELSARPLSLFCLLLAANAIALPYRNFVHDANLYGIQVLNRVESGRFDSDLYFKYGSQDKYSVFSIAAAPLVARLGLPLGFFLLYLASNSLLLYALQRFVRALIKEPLVATSALLFLAATEVPFGGLDVFHVNEPFLTPRIAANALVLFGLERLLVDRCGQAWAFMILALPLHPLMAFPGILVVACWTVSMRWRARTVFLSLILAASGFGAFLLNRSLASRYLGVMDDGWRENVHRVNLYHFPLDWTMGDWIRIALCFIVASISAGFSFDDVRLRRLILSMIGVAAVGIVGGIAACYMPYALPLQGQPFRWLWILQLSFYPLGFLLVRQLWAKPQIAARWIAVGLVAYLNDSTWNSYVFWLILLAAIVFAVIYRRGASRRPKNSDWPAWAAGFALALALPLWTLLKLGLVAVLRQQLSVLLDPIEMLELTTALFDPMCRLVLIGLTAVWLVKRVGTRWRFRLTCLCGCISACFIFFVLPASDFYLNRWTIRGQDKCFVASFLDRTNSHRTTPTLYWPCGQIDLVWFELRANNFFEWPHQIAGNVFSRGTASEGARRSLLVRKFELERWRKEGILRSPQTDRYIRKVFRSRVDEASSPHLSDLLLLCRESQLDFVILPQKFEGLYAATNNRVFIYDCRAIRAALHREQSLPIRALAGVPPIRISESEIP